MKTKPSTERVKSELIKESARLKEENALLRLTGRYRDEPTGIKYAFIYAQSKHFAVRTLCHVMDVARSGYYAWRRVNRNADSRD